MKRIHLVSWPSVKDANTALATEFIPEQIAYTSCFLLQQKETNNAPIHNAG